jgi:hypothetical protein
MYLLTPKKERLTHKILGLLVTKANETESPTAEKCSITISEICDKFNVSENKIHDALSAPQSAKEIKYDNFGTGDCVYAWDDSGFAYSSKKYLRECHKRVNDNIYDFTKWFVPLSLAFITIYSTIKVQWDNKTNRERIDRLQTKIDSITNKHAAFQIKKPLDSPSLSLPVFLQAKKYHFECATSDLLDSQSKATKASIKNVKITTE